MRAGGPRTQVGAKGAPVALPAIGYASLRMGALPALFV